MKKIEEKIKIIFKISKWVLLKEQIIKINNFLQILIILQLTLPQIRNEYQKIKVNMFK